MWVRRGGGSGGFKWAVRVDPAEKVTFKQRCEGGEGMNHEDMCGLGTGVAGMFAGQLLQ